MKNTNRLLAVILAVTIAVSGIVITTLTTNAIDVTVDNTKDVIATVKGSDIAGDGDGGNATSYSRDEEAGTFSFNGDCGNFYGIYLKGVEAGVYKVAYYLTIDNVSGNDRIRFKPYGGDVYYNVPYSTLKQYEGLKVMVVAVVNATGDFEVGGWPNTGLYATIDKVEIAKANYDFGANAGDYILIEEGIAHDIPNEYTQPADDQWTKSTSNKPTNTEVLNTQAWSYDFNESNYKTLFGDGEHGTNGDTVKATVAAGTGLTVVEDCPTTGNLSMNLNRDGYVIKYTGVIEATETGWYQLASYYIDNGYIVYIGGQKVFDYGKWDNWFDSGRLMYCGETFKLEAGKKYTYEAYYVEQGGGDNIQPVVLVDGQNRSFATAGISFYADVAADEGAVPEINTKAPALGTTADEIVYYNNFNGTPLVMDDDADAIDIGTNMIAGKTDVTIEVVIKPFDIRNNGGLMNNNTGLIGIGEAGVTDKYVLLGYMEGGALKVGVKASSDSNVERQTTMGMLNTNKWVSVKYVFTENTVSTYVDDILVCENDISNVAKIGDFTGKFVIGDEVSWGDRGFRGMISEIRVTTPKGEEDNKPVYPTEEKIISTIETNKEVKDSGDNYGMKFEDLAAGVYKIAYYMTIDSARDGAQMRISPIVSGEGYSYRCWIDWKTTDEMNGHTGVKNFMEANGTNKVILVSVITVPENGATIDAGFWQDDQAYIGTLDKVALATDGYDFIADTEYTWVDEKGYRGNEPETTFNEDAQQKILAVEGDWTMSTRPTVATKDPYVENKFVDADSNADGLNMTDNGGTNVGSTFNGAWLGFENFDFGTDGAKSVKIDYTGRLNRIMKDATVEVWIGGKNAEEGGKKVGSIATPETSGAADNWNTHATPEVNLTETVTGVNDVYFVMTGTAEGDLKNVANLYTFVFSKDAVDDGGDDKPDTPDKPTIVEGLNGEAWSFDGNEENYKKLFGDLALNKNGDIVKATVAAGTGLTKIDCQAIVPVDYVIDGDNYVIKYTGVMTVGESGWYQFATNKVDNGYVAYVGGVKVIDCAAWNWWNDVGNSISYGETVYLEAGVKYSYEAYFVEQGGGQVIIPQVIKADGTLYSYADAGLKFYANDTAENVAPAKWENVAYTFAGIAGINGSEGVVKENSVIKIPATATGQLWNYTWHGYTPDSVIKVAWYITVDSVADDVDPDASNITFDNNFFMEGNGLLDIPNSVFTENVGKKIIVVGVFNQPNTGMEGRWNIKAAGISFTVDKVVIGNEDTNFDCAAAELGGYTFIFEEANSDDIKFTPSDESLADDKPSGKPITGDIASVVAILAAGAAAIGGYKLRKKSK